MTDRVVAVAVGTQVWFEGSVWTVQEMAPSKVMLASGERLRFVATTLLATQAVVMRDGPASAEDEDLVEVLLSSLSSRERASLERRAEHLRDLLNRLETTGSDRRSGPQFEAKAAELVLSRPGGRPVPG